MLELPESNNLSAQINKTLVGKVIKEVKANDSPHGFAFYFGDPYLYPSLLLDRKIERAEPIGGNTEITLGNVKLMFGDGTNVRFYLGEKKDKIPKKHQLYIEFTDGSCLVCTISMYGIILAFEEGQNDENMYYRIAKEKPSPLTPAFNETYFGGIVEAAKKNISTKALLATEQRIPGLGNGCLHDILFNARLNPRTKIMQLKDSHFDALYVSVKNTLKDMVEKGGRDTEKDLFGNVCGYKTILSNKTIKNPCPVCGNMISRQAYLGGNIYFCPTCQPEIVI